MPDYDAKCSGKEDCMCLKCCYENSQKEYDKDLSLKKEKLICHVCGKEKKPYIVFMKTDILSFLRYEEARKDGEICKRCNSYHAMTGELKNATKQEFENAKKAIRFTKMMLRWWEKDKKLVVIDDKDNPLLTNIESTENENKRIWEGTENIAKWYRNVINK